MNPESKHEFSEFELQLRKLTPNGSSLSPEATFYRAGFEAACQQNSLASVTTSNTKSQSRFGLGMFVGVAASMLSMFTMQSLVSSTPLSTPPTIAQINVETLPGSVAEPGDRQEESSYSKLSEVQSASRNLWMTLRSLPEMLGIPTPPSNLDQPIDKLIPTRPRIGILASTHWESFENDLRESGSATIPNPSFGATSTDSQIISPPIHRFSSPEQLRLEGLL